jgi:hypothetical protein
MLLARRAPGDDVRATALLTEASAIARKLGIKPLQKRAEEAQRQTAVTS